MRWMNYVTRGVLFFVLINLTHFAHASFDKWIAMKKQDQDIFSAHPHAKPPSTFTIEHNQAVRKTLAFDDTRDREEAKKGLIAKPPYQKIMAEAGHVAWEMSSYDFLLQGKSLPSIHPSLYRQAILNMGYGLYEVVPNHIYQVRGFDLANMTLIKGNTGWIIIDPLTTKETARAALEFANTKLGKRPVAAVIFSHSHVDHFGGIRGVAEEDAVRNKKITLIAPKGFLDAAISENVLAGNAMSRRVQYQYGVLLPRSPLGHVDQAIGKNIANGNTGLMQPNHLISKDFEELTIDGIKMIFQNTPDTEAPVEMNTYFPQFKAFFAAENVTGTIHNIYTLRGAEVRNALNWSKQINHALYKFGQEAEVMFSAHNWPRWGNKRIQDVLRTQRDLYANMNNQVLHYANQGVTINEIHTLYHSPPSLQKQWAARSYHGSEAHNSRGIINRFLGYWDANPATLIPLSPRESAPLYVEMMGGAKKILLKSDQLIAQGRYLAATELLNKLVYAEPENQQAKNRLADAFEQIGYQQESTGVRNSFLQGAYELRTGLPKRSAIQSATPDVIRAMPTENWLDFIGISVDSHRAEGMQFTINLMLPDHHETFLLEMNHATLTHIKGYQSKNPDLSITLHRADLNKVMMGLTSFTALEQAGKAKFVGNRAVFDQLKSTLVRFTPDFEILPGTLNARPTPAGKKVYSNKKTSQSDKPFEFPITPEKND